MGGIMSLTGPADGMPYKIGVAQTDLLTGLYALNGILAALYHREKTGAGQFIDAALLDAQVAALSNAAQYYLTSGKVTPRMGNAHPTIVPYEAFEAADGHIILAVGNDRQFRDFCAVAKCPDLAADPRFALNKDRVRNRAALIPLVREIIRQRGSADWMAALEKAGVPCGPVNDMAQVFADPQVQARGMVTRMPHPLAAEDIALVANPMRFSKTPVSYRRPPPVLGAQSEEILGELLGLSTKDIAALREKGVI
jgi:crotonobetainyl-CoA:carnitine CoA-transferase CaiB-like acyl-CoA transferase